MATTFRKLDTSGVTYDQVVLDPGRYVFYTNAAGIQVFVAELNGTDMGMMNSAAATVQNIPLLLDVPVPMWLIWTKAAVLELVKVGPSSGSFSFSKLAS